MRNSKQIPMIKAQNPKPESESEDRVQLRVRVRMRAKDGQIDEYIWSAATCRLFPTDTEYHSGDKSPHSKRAVIVQLHLTKAEPEATRTSNYTPRITLI